MWIHNSLNAKTFLILEFSGSFGLHRKILLGVLQKYIVEKIVYSYNCSTVSMANRENYSDEI